MQGQWTQPRERSHHALGLPAVAAAVDSGDGDHRMDAETEDKMTTETPARKPRKRGPKTQPKFPCLRCGRVRQARNSTAICMDCQGADPWFVQKARAS